MRPHPSGDLSPTGVLVRDRLPTNRSDTAAQRVGDPLTAPPASVRDRVECGYGCWDEDRGQDHQDEYGDREHGRTQLSPQGGSVNFRETSLGKSGKIPPARRIRCRSNRIVDGAVPGLDTSRHAFVISRHGESRLTDRGLTPRRLPPAPVRRLVTAAGRMMNGGVRASNFMLFSVLIRSSPRLVDR